MARDGEEALGPALADLLAGELPAPIEIRDLERLTGGASRETWGFDAADADGVVHRLLLRRDFADGATQNPDALVGRQDALDREGEFALLRRLHELGLPVARPLARPAGDGPLGEGFVMERLEGETTPRRLVRDPPPGLAAQLGELLASLHALEADDLPRLPARPVADKLTVSRELLDRAPAPRPACELALTWAHQRACGQHRMALVHGDFRTSNYAVGPQGLTGIFDWEFSHLGDPVEDVAYVCLRPWRFGAFEREVTGVGHRNDLYEAYRRAGGEPVDPERVRFWEVLNLLTAIGVFSSRAARPAGGGSAVEGASIGRRVAELEYDLLDLLD